MDEFAAAFATQWLPATLLLAYALLFALAEIEIEGPHGWAEKLPTWYRVTPWYARAFSWMSGGKPLTGYHATMIPLAFMSFHLGLAFGLQWSPAFQAGVLARFTVWIVVWDALWFLLNPHFGWTRFRPGEVWWLGRVWILRIPLEYWAGLAISFALTAVARSFGLVSPTLAEHAAYCAILVAACPAAATCAPAYQRWHRYMRRDGADEREQALRG